MNLWQVHQDRASNVVEVVTGGSFSGAFVVHAETALSAGAFMAGAESPFLLEDELRLVLIVFTGLDPQGGLVCSSDLGLHPEDLRLIRDRLL